MKITKNNLLYKICVMVFYSSTLLFAYGHAETGNEEMIACFLSAAKRYNINTDLLMAIGVTESNLETDAVNVNRGGTKDIGVMQVNSFWWPVLESYGYSERDLYEPCINIFIGAWILADAIAHYGNTWRAVGSYHAGTGQGDDVELRRIDYIKKIKRSLNNMSSR